MVERIQEQIGNIGHFHTGELNFGPGIEFDIGGDLPPGTEEIQKLFVECGPFTWNAEKEILLFFVVRLGHVEHAIAYAFDDGEIMIRH